MILSAQRQPSLPQLFEQEIQWVPDQQTNVSTPWIRDKDGQWRIPQGWKPQEIEESGNISDFYSTRDGQKKILDLATREWTSQKDGGYNSSGELVPGRSFPDILNQYQRELGGQQFPQGNNPGVSGFTGQLEGSQPAAPPVQQAPPQQAPQGRTQQLIQLREAITTGQLDDMLPGGNGPKFLTRTGKRRQALQAIDGLMSLEQKYPSAGLMSRDEKSQAIAWAKYLRPLGVQ